MNEPLTLEERAASMAELKAEALHEADWEFDEEHLILQLQELEEKGSYSGDSRRAVRGQAGVCAALVLIRA